jgi:uncharacterized phiE125 gp8 family phage protein
MDDIYTVTTGPTEEPITLEETKLFLRVDGDDDDTLIQALIKAAISQGEKYTGRFFVQRTITGQFADVASSRCERYPFVELRRAPLVSITSFKVFTDGAFADIPSDDYQLKDQSSYARILIVDGLTADDVPYPLQVIFVAGYGEAKVVPDDIKTALKEHVAFMYENRGDVHAVGKETMPIQSKSLYGKYKIINTF